MTLELGPDEPIVPTTSVPEHVTATTFRAQCETCPWEGRDRTSSLTALHDYDRHVLTAAHRNAEWQRALLVVTAEEDDDDNPFDAL